MLPVKSPAVLPKAALGETVPLTTPPAVVLKPKPPLKSAVLKTKSPVKVLPTVNRKPSAATLKEVTLSATSPQSHRWL